MTGTTSQGGKPRGGGHSADNEAATTLSPLTEWVGHCGELRGFAEEAQLICDCEIPRTWGYMHTASTRPRPTSAERLVLKLPLPAGGLNATYGSSPHRRNTDATAHSTSNTAHTQRHACIDTRRHKHVHTCVHACIPTCMDAVTSPQPRWGTSASRRESSESQIRGHFKANTRFT